jgi:hypothetical protein
MPEEIKAVESGEAPVRKTADQIRARKRANTEPDRPSHRPETPRARKTPVHSRDPIDDLTRELITKCAGPNAGWRTLDRMSSTAMVAKSAIKDVIKRLGDAVKTRTGSTDDEFLIEGDREELLVRAGLMALAGQGPPDSSAEIAGLRAENASMRAELADANAEIEKLRAEVDRAEAEIQRLKSALQDKVVEKIAAKLAANGETKPTEDDVVMTALG